MDALKTCLIVSIVGAAFGQNAAPRASFEVASIKPSARAAEPSPQGAMAMDRLREAMRNSRPVGWMQKDQARVTLRDQSLLDLIATAWRVRASQVSGPAWLSELRFDIDAKIPEGSPADQTNEMLQTLLEERFGVQVHQEKMELPGYALLIAKSGLKLQESAAPGADDDKPKAAADPKKMMEELHARTAGGAEPGVSTRSWSKRGGTMTDVANWLSGGIHAPVVDETGLTGKYDLVIETRQAAGDSPEVAAAQAAAKLGLKLEARKVPTLTIAVDRANREPTAN
jgi:uncharacterized protein (TIGR03435 family)